MGIPSHVGYDITSNVLVVIVLCGTHCAAVYNPFTVDGDYTYNDKGRSYNNLRLFYSFKSACDVFDLPEHTLHPGRDQLIHVIKEVTESMKPKELSPGSDRKPFIVIESNDIYTRKIFSKILSYNIRGKLLRTPPDSLNHLNRMFIGSSVRRAFYAIGMYVSAFNVTSYWKQKPVIMTGYWMDHFAYVVTKAYRNFPVEQIDRSVFVWPSDLLRPDIVFYLNAPPISYRSLSSPQVPNRWKNAMTEVYERMSYLTKPRIIMTNVSRGGFKTVYPEIKKHIKQILGDKIRFLDDRPPYRNHQQPNRTTDA